jgi:dynein heavy chain
VRLKNRQFLNVLLPTVETIKARMMMDVLLNQARPQTGGWLQSGVNLFGSAGTSKSSAIMIYLEEVKADKLFRRINFSSATRPEYLQTIVEEECNCKMAKDFCPPGNRTLILFLDDLSMPDCNRWGDQVSLEFMRHLIEQGGFYSLERSERGSFKAIRKLEYLATMSGQNDIPSRLKKLFFHLCMMPMKNMEAIFLPILRQEFFSKTLRQ